MTRELPYGAVAVRKCKNPQGKLRYIKAGRGRYAWLPYARWWWETHRGAVPKGKRVIHRDGDSLNDDPSNLMLVSFGDLVYLWSQRATPDELARRSRRLRAGCKKRTRETLARDRLMGVFQRTLWYAVDHKERTVSGPHGDYLWHAARHFDPSILPSRGRGARLAAEVCGVRTSASGMEVAVLQALKGGPLDTPALLAESSRLAGLLHVPPPPDRRAITACVFQLRRRGLLAPCIRRGKQSNVHALSEAGQVAVMDASPRACVRGEDARNYVDNEGYEYRAVLPEGC